MTETKTRELTAAEKARHEEWRSQRWLRKAYEEIYGVPQDVGWSSLSDAQWERVRACAEVLQHADQAAANLRETKRAKCAAEEEHARLQREVDAAFEASRRALNRVSLAHAVLRVVAERES